jgi:hypothetical protein
MMHGHLLTSPYKVLRQDQHEFLQCVDEYQNQYFEYVQQTLDAKLKKFTIRVNEKLNLP